MAGQARREARIDSRLQLDQEGLTQSFRMLTGMLADKPVDVQSDMDSQVCLKHVQRVCDIAKTLLGDPSKIERVEILISK